MDFLIKITRVFVSIGPVGLISVLFLFAGLIVSRNKLILLKNVAFTYLGLFAFSILMFFYIMFFNPIIGTIISSSSKTFQVIDTGWFIAQKVDIYTPYTIFIFLFLIGINVLMLFLRLTRTINLDIWNLWISLFSGVLVYEITGVYWMGFLFSGVIATVTFVIADIYAPYLENYYGIRGISVPNPPTIIWTPIPNLINFLFNRIPFVRKINIFYEEIQYKLGVVGEPMVIGFILGMIIGAVSKYKEFSYNLWPSILYSLFSGLYLAVIAVLMPRAISLLYRGIIPIIYDMKTFINSKFTKREIYIGINPMILAGNSSVIGLSTIMIPLTVYIATILPGNKMLPSADLVMIPLILIWAISLSRGDIFRSFISAIIIIPIILLISTNMTGFITDFLTDDSGKQIVKGFNNYSSMGMGSNLIYWVLIQIMQPIFKLFS